MNDPVTFPCLIRTMGGWPIRANFGQMKGHCSFDAEGCELLFKAGDKEEFVFGDLHRIRVVDHEQRGAYVDLHRGRRGVVFRVWVLGPDRCRESKAFFKYMCILETQHGTRQETAG